MAACELIKLQAKSIEEVATHFGIEKVAPPQALKQLQQLLAEMGELTMLNESDLLSLIERVTLERSGVLEGMVSQSYLNEKCNRAFQTRQSEYNDVICRVRTAGIGLHGGKAPRPILTGELGLLGEFSAALVAQTDELARRLKQWNERFLETKLALQERTIEVRVEQLSSVLADQKSATRLRANKQWVKKSEQIRLWCTFTT